MTLFNINRPLGFEVTFEDRDYAKLMSEYENNGVRNSVSKDELIRFFIKNYSKNTAQTVGFLFNAYTRAVDKSRIVQYIKDEKEYNTIIFIQKTSISGKQINDIITDLKNIGFIIEELTNVSLYLQQDKQNTIRVFKQTNTTTDHVQYFVLGDNHLRQTVYYTCLGLYTNWYSHLLTGIDQERLAALTTLCAAIGRTNENDYKEAILNCFKLCYDPTEVPIDFSEITTMLQPNLTDKIRNQEQIIHNFQNQIDAALEHYTDLTNKLNEKQWTLTKLLTDQTNTNDKEIINDVKKFKSIIAYEYIGNTTHQITIRSKMILDSKSIVKKILDNNNTRAHQIYGTVQAEKRRLLTELWLDETLTLEFCTSMKKLQNTALPTQIITPNYNKKTKNTIPNPHLIHFRCFGGNQKLLCDAQNNNDLSYYLGLLTACNSNLNTGDATVLTRFINNLFNTYYNEPILYSIKEEKYYSPKERMATYATI